MQNKTPLYLTLLFLLSYYQKAKTQDFYNTEVIQEIHITFNQENWDHLLDSLYVDGQQERLLAAVTINGILLDSVGIRYKGFSSVSTDRIKNPFNIKLDYVRGDQQFNGFAKVKLSNVIQDPSFLREVLSYDICRKYMPAPRANYAHVYINEIFWGLYTNVESIDKDFVGKQYGSNDNPFFKCNPEVLDFDGENSNLGNSPGNDTSNYYPYYDKRSDYGWANLYELIETLNEDPSNIETLLNVDRTLWMHAFNYTLINFDSYVGFAQNYYLYEDNNGRFNPILWDLNQSFASYRLTDASEHFDGFSIAEAKVMDPLLHYSSVSVIPRPLMRNLFENDRYRRMYIAHMKTIIEENFSNQEYASRAQTLHDLIDASVQADTNKFYTYTDFQENINTTVSDLVDYPGITDLMDARSSFLLADSRFQGEPEISNISTSPQSISIGDELFVFAEVSDADNVFLAFRYGGNAVFNTIEMLDDGSQNDGAANDGLYGIKLSDIGNSIQYYFYAENQNAGQFSPARAAYEFYSLQSNINAPDLVINEFMASNAATISDEYGEFDDWIELYNTTEYAISTAGLYLSDNPAQMDKWAMPDALIPANDYLIIWADNDPEQGALHANFKLSAGGENILLSYLDGAVIDSLSYSEQNSDISTGRYPNGTGPFVEMIYPTPDAQNSLVNSLPIIVENYNFQIYPNPAKDQFHISLENPQNATLEISTQDGRLIKTRQLDAHQKNITLNSNSFVPGVYFISIQSGEIKTTKKIIIIK